MYLCDILKVRITSYYDGKVHPQPSINITNYRGSGKFCILIFHSCKMLKCEHRIRENLHFPTPSGASGQPGKFYFLYQIENSFIGLNFRNVCNLDPLLPQDNKCTINDSNLSNDGTKHYYSNGEPVQLMKQSSCSKMLFSG